MADNVERQRLKFANIEFEQRAGGRHRAEVRLLLGNERTFVGVAEEPQAGGELRCVVLATIDALSAAVGGDPAFELLGVRVVQAFDASVVLVALSASVDGSVRRLVGSYLADETPHRGAALATLNATNRVMGLTMFAA